MSEPDIETQHIEPYQSFKFRILWDGQYVAGVSRMSALRRLTEVVEPRTESAAAGGQRTPGRTRYEPITLEKGLTEDPVFEAWADQVTNRTKGGGSEQAYCKDIRIEIYDEAGNLALAYTVYRCWPSEYQALPILDGAVSGSLLQVLKLEHAGWERDLSIAPPSAAPE